jgi:thiopeptide-type bacteriocin biosynthesis protein
MPVPVGEVLPRRLPWEHGPAADRWVQVGLAPAERRPHALFGELAGLVRAWRENGVVEDFFFMHKPPGVRARFAPRPGRAPFVRAELRRLVRDWCARDLVAGVEPGVYEPEDHLFGGPAAMDHAHRMFTADAVTWLEYHARPRQAPAWALSLAVLRPVFDAMGLDGRRERDVWARVAAAGRVIPTAVDRTGPTGADRTDATGDAADGLRRWWRAPEELLAALPEDVRALAARHAGEVAPHAAAWAAALRGADTCQAVAWYVVFDWNRAALTFGKQALLTEALTTVERSCGDVR